jgi:hypothetical protein
MYNTQDAAALDGRHRTCKKVRVIVEYAILDAHPNCMPEQVVCDLVDDASNMYTVQVIMAGHKWANGTAQSTFNTWTTKVTRWLIDHDIYSLQSMRAVAVTPDSVGVRYVFHYAASLVDASHNHKALTTQQRVQLSLWKTVPRVAKAVLMFLGVCLLATMLAFVPSV